MSKRTIVGGAKDSNGIFILNKEPDAPIEPAPQPDTSIDDLLKAGLQNIRGVMRAIASDVGTGLPSRETVQNLKDIMLMLKDLKKDEQALLTEASDEDLQNMLKK